MELIARAEAATSLESLLGIEGTAAWLYFEAFGELVKPPASEPDAAALTFDFEGATAARREIQ